MTWLRPFLIALQFLTLLPIRLRERPDEVDIGRSVLYYPLVGLLIGVLLAGLAVSLRHSPELLRAALLLAVWVLVTGALHLDGLADSADAWLGGHGDSARTLAIMKDPCCGPAAVVTLVVVLLLKFTALAGLAAGGAHWAPVLAATLGRTALPLLFLTTPYVRPGGLGSALAIYARRQGTTGLVVASTAVALILAAGSAALWALLAAFGLFLLLRHLMIGRIGGTTGDTAGALVELTETAILLVLVVL